MTIAIDTVHGQGDGNDMPGVGAVKTVPSIDGTKDVPAELNSVEVQADSADFREDVRTVKKPCNG